MTEERAKELIGQKVVLSNGWKVVLRSIFTDDWGQRCGMCYIQDDGKDWAGVSEVLDGIKEME